MSGTGTRTTRQAVRSLLVASLIVLVSAPGAAAETSEFDISIVRDTRPRTSIVSHLTAFHTVTVRDRATGGPPQGDFVLFAQAVNAAGEKSPFFACGHTNDVDSRTPPGVFDCTVIVDHGGAWDFVAVVSKRRSDADQAPVPLTSARVPFELATADSVTGEVPGAGLSGSATDVAVLFGHAAFAVAWFACVALLAVLAVPGARRYLSTAGCHRLERRLDPLVKGALITTGLVLGSGGYLTVTQSAYDAPFSASEVDAVFALPYGKPYFLALAAKIALYLVMVAATVPLVREARRRMLSSVDAPAAAPAAPTPLIEPVPVGAPAGGGVACEIRTAVSPVAVQEPSSGRLGVGPGGVSSVLIAAGGVGIALCVTLLKYFHELIESARGLL